MSTRLTNAMREKIRNDALRAVCLAPLTLIEEMKTDMADKFYDGLYGKDAAVIATLEHAWAKKIRWLTLDIEGYDDDDEARHKDDDVFLTRWGSRHGGDGHVLHNEEPTRRMRMSAERLFPTDPFFADFTIDKDHPQWDQSRLILRKYKSVQKRYTELSDTLTALLWSYSTVEKLLDAWPDGKPYMPTEAATRKTYPVVDGSLAKSVRALMTPTPMEV